ncbi:DUF5689 domain-containing protein [Pseudofulvibacter geojedonensis]|uniref:DUF5689 domain-containing protein n=1 Tax=Pseudofulvibacter geojedonensis TaxID=1123758 RepID=A0ABW3I3I9_9FLAO
MKTIKYLKIITALIAAIAFTACVQDDDFNTPVITEVDPGLTANTTFAIVSQMYTGSIVTFPEDSDLILEGYVVSSDQSGNIYKNVYVQDAPENPTLGFRIDIDMTDTYLKYDLGRKVYIKLAGLALSDSNGVMAIGKASGVDLERIPELEAPNSIIRSTEVATIVPKLTTIADVQAGLVSNSVLIQLDDVQVPVSEVGNAYANPDNTFSVNRNIISCADNSTIILRNSGFADFKNQLMPQLKGSLVAVLAQYNSDKQLFIRDVEDFNFSENRCDPLFFEDFANLDAWENISVIGSQNWYIDTFNASDPVARMSGFSGGPQDNEDWLISPAIDLSSATTPILSFENLKRYSGLDLEVYYSVDYDEMGDPSTATWTALNPTLDTNTGSWSSWTQSGDLDLSAAVGGNVYVAFKYVSTTSGGAATWQVDAVQIVEQ